MMTEIRVSCPRA